jgi:hypothetical protein
METIVAFLLGGLMGGTLMAVIAASKEDDDR